MPSATSHTRQLAARPAASAKQRHQHDAERKGGGIVQAEYQHGVGRHAVQRFLADVVHAAADGGQQ
ncbi:MAG: hypothetical protein Q4C79_06730 [Neisseria sp.]|uniref:hypothetical protein n=1 Tax=Neisseria sp. TaxID=192066 RepID=UPI0026DAE6F5|nr:hypothetical protein [Neisseria sp.]MDO4248639.1 hypothetical protein [Neisseria sp.]